MIDSQEKLDKNLKDNKKLILIVVDLKSTLYKLYILPIVLKSWVWAYTFRVLDSKKDIIDISKYDVKEIPCLILFKEWEVEKVFEWEETVKKLVISPSLDLAVSGKSDSDKSKTKDNTDEKETKWNKQEEKSDKKTKEDLVDEKTDSKTNKKVKSTKSDTKEIKSIPKKKDKSKKEEKVKE